MAVVAPTAGDVRDVMIEGESGLLAVCPPWNRPHYEPSKRRLTWPNGALVTAYSADEPERARGPQHDGLWADEIASWRYPEAWDLFMFGLRLGNNPRAVVTTTPKPIPLVKELLASPTTFVTRGSSYENRRNLAPAFFQQIIRKYEGTRLGRQELNAEILDDFPGALWARDLINQKTNEEEDRDRVVVAIDPAVTSGEDSDETGIIVASKGVDGLYYVLDDLTCKLTPNGWAMRAVNAYHRFKADRIVAETNNGGDMVLDTIKRVDPEVSLRKVTATRGKRVRAEPIAALYEQGRVFHQTAFPELEDQMCSFVPDDVLGPDDRVDALVWALTELSGTTEYTLRAL
jgi:predicted phage terminase large subunit-like protein